VKPRSAWEVVWRAGECGNCCGLVMLPKLTLSNGSVSAVAMASNSMSEVRLHAIDDGRIISQLRLPVHGGSITYLAADPTTNTIYVSGSGVRVLQWDTAAVALVESAATVPLPAGVHGSFPLAVMPPAPGCTDWLLLVGQRDRDTLHVFTLPDFLLVGTHKLPIPISGLAADPAGTALVIGGNYTGECVRVLAWPLPAVPVDSR
jgi:hypothetical protein